MPYVIECHGKYIKKDSSLNSMVMRGGLSIASSKSTATRFNTISIAKAYAADWEEIEYARGNRYRCKIVAVS